MTLVVPFPVFDPVAVAVGPLAIRWYALAYIAGIVLGWAYGRWLLRRDSLWGARPRPTLAEFDDMLTWVTLGVVIGGRLGFVFLYMPGYYVQHPLEALMIWHGGMAFHGGLAGVIVAVLIVSRAKKLSPLAMFDLLGVVVPIGLFFGRIANFINGELWGRTSEVAWAMVFPGAGPEPRHPSQLYQAALEGVALFVILAIAVRMGGLKRPGLCLGLFGAGYGVARIIGEFFRQYDPQIGLIFDVITMGQILSIPMVLVGGAFIWRALRRPAAAAAPQSAA